MTATTASHRSPGPSIEALDALAGRLGWTFLDRGLLAQGMAHRSWCAEQDGEPSNERLEFLGDAVLGMVVADHVYRTYPELTEGQLTDARKAVVNATCLAEVAVQVRLGEALALGAGHSCGIFEDHSGTIGASCWGQTMVTRSLPPGVHDINRVVAAPF